MQWITQHRMMLDAGGTGHRGVAVCGISTTHGHWSMKIYRLIAQMIAVDEQPFSVISNECYHDLMHGSTHLG